MNSFGRLFRLSILGESHGECVAMVVDGCPPGTALAAEDFAADLARRRGGAAGTTPRAEADAPLLESGVFEGHATGAPILIRFANVDVDSAPYEKLRTTPRPGHADFVARRRYRGFHDHRGGGHFSGRLTVGLVAAGVIAKKILAPARVEARLLEAGGQADVEAAVAAALAAHDSVGALVECRVSGLPVGLGEPFFDSVESLISHLVFSIGGVRGIEFGAGFAASRMRGSECNDPLVEATGRTATNNAGGVNGGLTNGNELVLRLAVKPTASIGLPQQTVDLENGARVPLLLDGRHDACIGLRLPPILEAAVAVVLADLLLVARAYAPATS